ncbi:MAG: molecular chaperone TorD family protein [Candidatus Poribacteria bacterium]
MTAMMTTEVVSPEDRTAFAETAVARSGMYRLLAEVLAYPSPAPAEAVRTGEFHRELATFAAYLPPQPNEDAALRELCMEGLRRRDAAHGEVTEDGLSEDYSDVFGHALSRDCPPYETEYAGAHIFLQSQELADIGGFYAAYGLAIDVASHERLDHISPQLEFMHVLCEREAYALNNDRDEQAEACSQTQGQFIEDHLGRWGTYFAQLLAKRGAGTVYGHIAPILEWFLSWETEYLDATPDLVTEIQAGAEPEDDEEQSDMGMESADWVGDMTQ